MKDQTALLERLARLRSDDQLGHALLYASVGIAVFPLAWRSKFPRAGSHGHLDASTDPDRIRAWWAENEAYNIGARPGPEELVLDGDPRHGATLSGLRELCGEHPLPSDRAAITGSDGVHLWYSHALTGPRRPRVEGIPGWDVKGHNGFVVMPPSVHPATLRRYTWLYFVDDLPPLPDPLVAHIARPEPVRTLAVRGGGVGMARMSSAGLLAFLRRAEDGERNEKLFWALCRAAERGLDGTFERLCEIGTTLGLTPGDVAQTAHSARRRVGNGD